MLIMWECNDGLAINQNRIEGHNLGAIIARLVTTNLFSLAISDFILELGNIMSQKSDPNFERLMRTLASRLHEVFDGKIDMKNADPKNVDNFEDVFLTRAYLALFFLDEFDLSAQDAANCITDGFHDDGIDGIYVDEKEAKIYFAQSKWRKNGLKGVKVDEITRFRDGIKHVLSPVWNEDNKDLWKFRKIIEDQLETIDTRVEMIFAHTIRTPLNSMIDRKVSEFIGEYEEHDPGFMSFREWGFSQGVRAARSNTRPEKIDVEVMLEQFGVIAKPHKAVYGSVAASDLAAWYKQHNNKLFAENLRFGIEKSDVNEGMILTASTIPENFWYYNNGITAVCDSFKKKAIGGSRTSSGVFDVSRISIINGAQTVTSLSKVGKDLADVRVHMRIISLESTPDGFASNVTTANNTQNNLNPVDFVASDPNQERIRREASQLAIQYSYRRGEKDPDPEHGFTVRDATIAAACSSGDLKLAVSAKRYISGLWENTKKDPYTRLFNDATTASSLWDACRVMFTVDKLLANFNDTHSGRNKLVSIHANRFILFMVFENMRSTNGSISFGSSSQAGIKILVDKIYGTLCGLLQDTEGYLGNIFKNSEKQVHLVDQVKEALSAAPKVRKRIRLKKGKSE